MAAMKFYIPIPAAIIPRRKKISRFLITPTNLPPVMEWKFTLPRVRKFPTLAIPCGNRISKPISQTAAHRQAEGRAILAICPEFGPRPYMTLFRTQNNRSPTSGKLIATCAIG
jgi:hypothetical protein